MKTRSPELIALKCELMRRGIDYRDVARMVGLSPKSVANILCGDSDARPARIAIEAALRVGIWPDLAGDRVWKRNKK